MWTLFITHVLVTKTLALHGNLPYIIHFTHACSDKISHLRTCRRKLLKCLNPNRRQLRMWDPDVVALKQQELIAQIYGELWLLIAWGSLRYVQGELWFIDWGSLCTSVELWLLIGACYVQVKCACDPTVSTDDRKRGVFVLFSKSLSTLNKFQIDDPECVCVLYLNVCNREWWISCLWFFFKSLL